MGALAVVLQPRKDRVDVVPRGVVAEDRAVQVTAVRQVPAVAAQVVTGGESGVVDVVRVLHPVAVAVTAGPRPGGRDELHGPDGRVVGGVAVVGTVVGVLDEFEAVAVELRAEDLGGGGAVRVDPAAAGLARLDLADGGEQLPGQIAAGLGPLEFGRGLLVGIEDGRGYARLGLDRRDGGGAVGRRGARGVQRRQVRVVRRVAGRAAVTGGRVGRGLSVGGGGSAVVVDRGPRGLGGGQCRDRGRGHGGGHRSLAQPPAELRRHKVNPSRGRPSALLRLSLSSR